MIDRQAVPKFAEYLLVGVIVGLLVEHSLIQLNSDRRYALYNIRRELKLNMSRTKVEAIISRHQTPFMIISHGDGLALSVNLGGPAQFCHMFIAFERDELINARIRGEDGPHDRFRDAPSDLE